ncbi:tRNA (guanine(37)-N1)-methyltransferase [Rhinatrema bivittatum]|uniref:tRNA (guanine(37)-N1)-methyltransferase n=1 Tax=Rhinatrema bivittatum TaxID=194408 RepID=UPI00112A9D60|nr:tRNA (guanine(37)-N1)-methyltransferase [Rhinatrema bivittatum]
MMTVTVLGLSTPCRALRFTGASLGIRSMRLQLWHLYGSCVQLLKAQSNRTASTTTLLVLQAEGTQDFYRTLRHCKVFHRHRFTTMPDMLEDKSDSELYSPNSQVRGMTTLDRAAFKRTISVPVLQVKKEKINKLVKYLKNRMIKRPGLKRVLEDLTDEGNKLVLLDPHQISSDESFDKSDHAILKQFQISPCVSKYDLELTYENFKTEEILRAVLPEGQDVTSAFSRVGHIAHMNLRDHQLPFKTLIGQVVIDKNPGITSVVNKTNLIDTTYRYFQMEVLAGENNMITKVKENNISYEFDFSKVYWNPRLSTEHERIVGLLNPGDVLFDVFAGVGPFAIPAAKKNCTVFANDLNPESYKWLLYNCKLNKVDKKIQVFNMDGRDFLLGTVKEELIKQMALLSNESEKALHIVMNLPALAIEFLDALKHLLPEAPGHSTILPTVHCYSFSKDDDPAADVRRRAEAFLGTCLAGRCSIHLVRNVAPNKEMMCISFGVPAEVLYEKHAASQERSDEPEPKRPRIVEELSAAKF